jgi:hypothetical protein
MKNQLVWGFPNEQSVTAGEISGSDQYFQKTLTRADLLGWVAPITILPTTPNDTYYDVTKVLLEFIPNGTAYNTPKDLLVVTNGIFLANVDATAIAGFALKKAAILINKFSTIDGDFLAANPGSALTIASPGGAFTDPGVDTAKGTLKVKVWYQIRQIA